MRQVRRRAPRNHQDRVSREERLLKREAWRGGRRAWSAGWVCLDAIAQPHALLKPACELPCWPGSPRRHGHFRGSQACLGLFEQGPHTTSNHGYASWRLGSGGVQGSVCRRRSSPARPGSSPARPVSSSPPGGSYPHRRPPVGRHGTLQRCLLRGQQRLRTSWRAGARAQQPARRWSVRAVAAASDRHRLPARQPVLPVRLLLCNPHPFGTNNAGPGSPKGAPNSCARSHVPPAHAPAPLPRRPLLQVRCTAPSLVPVRCAARRPRCLSRRRRRPQR